MKVKLPDCNKCAHKEVCMYCKNVVHVKNSLKVKIKPYCRWCHNEMCVNDECPVRGDYCPVPDIPGICMYEERHEMTPKEAWHNICVRLTDYANEHGFSEEDVIAEVLVYSVICEAEDGKDDEKSDD